jgi:HK97 family phage portal protein
MHRVAIVSGGMKFTPFPMNNEDAQCLETREFGVRDVCRIFRVPPFLVADLGQSNYSNITALDSTFAKYSLQPWVSNLEAAFTAKLLGPRQRQTYFVEFDLKGLLRGEHESRMRGYQSAIYAGIMSPNECRQLENLPPREGGDVFLQPTNTAPSPYSPQQQGGAQP